MDPEQCVPCQVALPQSPRTLHWAVSQTSAADPETETARGSARAGLQRVPYPVRPAISHIVESSRQRGGIQSAAKGRRTVPLISNMNHNGTRARSLPYGRPRFLQEVQHQQKPPLQRVRQPTRSYHRCCSTARALSSDQLLLGDREESEAENWRRQEGPIHLRRNAKQAFHTQTNVMLSRHVPSPLCAAML